MPEENEKVEDFISLWKKKMTTDLKKPSALGETLEIIKAVGEENEDLRNKIKENIDLLTKTEEIVKKTLEENKLLKEEIKQAGMIAEVKTSGDQQENIELNNKVQTLLTNLSEKEEELRVANIENNELKLQVETLLAEQESRSDSASSPSEVIPPLEAPKTSKIKPSSSATSSATLEILCQDLQSDLNKYKRIVEKLNKEKSEFQRNIKRSGVQLEPEEMKELKLENENLRRDLSKVQESLKQKTEEASGAISTDDLEKKINGLQNDLKEKDNLIVELKKVSETPVSVQSTPMTGLIEDLQDRINKLKITIEEKNIIIEKLKTA